MKFDINVFPENSLCDENGNISIDNYRIKDIVEATSTPVMIYSYKDIVKATRSFVEVFDRTFFATKAAPIVGIENIICSLGVGCDVASIGELEVAIKANCDPGSIIVHGNAKSDEFIRRSLEIGVLRIVIEDEFECDRIEKIARSLQINKVDVQLRITPGIEAHTHEYLMTGAIDSKFGCAIEGNVAQDVCKRIVNSEILDLKGFHCHIGSQIFEIEPYVQAARVIISFYVHLKQDQSSWSDSLNLTEINFGGGFGIQYSSEDDPPLPIEIAKCLRKEVDKLCRENDLLDLQIWAEPGRAIVGQAGISVYRVVSIKEIPGIRKYIALDGGMSDNIRPCLYGAQHFVYVDGYSGGEYEIVTIAGMHCEEGDILARDCSVPKDICIGDIVIMASTGAYSWAMQSNYNMVMRPSVVVVDHKFEGTIKEVVRRETIEDLLERMP